MRIKTKQNQTSTDTKYRNKKKKEKSIPHLSQQEKKTVKENSRTESEPMAAVS